MKKSKNGIFSTILSTALFALYYSLRPQNHPLSYNLGYRHNLIGSQKTLSGPYFALDIFWKNPLGQ